MAVSTRRKKAQGEPEARRWSNEPTALEVAEGAAWRALQHWPDDMQMREAHARAFNALSRSPGCRFGSFRCQSCGVFVIGRRQGQPCGYCGETLVGVEDRATR